jgi:hypothetical protein
MSPKGTNDVTLLQQSRVHCLAPRRSGAPSAPSNPPAPGSSVLRRIPSQSLIAAVQVQPIINAVQAALAGQGSLAGGDVAVEEAIEHLVSALAPAIRQAAMELAEQAACEVRAQLPDRTVDLVLADGDPSLRIADAAIATEAASNEELDARITLRVPPSLKSLIEDAAETAGASVNSWVLDVLARRARKPAQGRGFRMTHSFDL